MIMTSFEKEPPRLHSRLSGRHVPAKCGDYAHRNGGDDQVHGKDISGGVNCFCGFDI
jgi:hypothetical protein